MVQVAVLGYGTVGSGVVEVIDKNKEIVSGNVGQELDVKYILDLRDFPDDPYGDKVIHDIDTILNDNEVSIVCEVMGGVGAAYQFTKAALQKGKSVCTSNKELVAKHGPELLQLAKENNCSYLFEASVGGGIPIIRPLNDCLTAERIENITGILNGTTNYILTKMEREGADFATVLKEAQEKGYAERNPEADVEGHDACRKIAILSSLMTGKTVDSEKIYTEGITKVTADDFVYAKATGRTIKLLAKSDAIGEGEVLAMVAPFMVDKDHPLAMVNDVFNAVFVRGNMLGDSMYYGRGAGKLPTASAVVGDVVECARNLGKNIPCRWSAEDAILADMADTEDAYYVRVKADRKAEAQKVFGDSRLVEIAGRDKDFAVLTNPMKEKEFAAKCGSLKDAVLSRIRLY
ncbi:MAG: homoserine dehydrogenase [Lachnospiraceae bacterium]|nr:homoserine dehydrogenase [Lachnospiraceae bacterium]MBR1854379.1 homoserine dehydrogenase [Lachnospiraceae bacterium]